MMNGVQRVRPLVALVCGLGLLVGAVAPAGADTVDDKRRQVAQLADRLDSLQDRSVELAEAYNDAVYEFEQAEAEAQAAQTKLARLDEELGGLRVRVADLAVRAYVYGDQARGLAGLLTSGSLVDGAVQRAGYGEVALGANLELTDEVRAKLEDAEYQRTLLEQALARREQAANQVAANKQAVEAAISESEQLLSQAQGELAVALQEEQLRRQQEAERRAQEEWEAAQRRADDEASRQSPSTTAGRTNSPSPSSPGTTRPGRPPSTNPPDKPKAGGNVPPPSPGAAGAVAAALSQLGVPYKFAAASPGVAFDCSGLTMWAWGRAGVRLPHSSRAQAAMLPRVPLSALQPGDLIFSHTPVGHVGMYIGNGQMVHAPRTGDVVKIARVSRNAVSAGRPGV